MPKVSVAHFNPPDTQGLTRCGMVLRRVRRHTTDKNNVTCNNCLRFLKMDAR